MTVGMLYGLVVIQHWSLIILCPTDQVGEGELGRQTEHNIAVLLKDWVSL